MTTYELPYFGKVTLSEDDDYHEIEDVDINGSSVSITIDCMGETPSKAQGTAIEQLLAHLPELDQQIRNEFIKVYRSIDYTLPEVTDEILVVMVDEERKIIRFTIES